MKMLIFASLAKAKLNTESIKGSNLVAVRHMINHLNSRYIEQCMNIQQNMLYKTWTAGLRRRRRLLKKRQNMKKTCKIKTYMLPAQTKTGSCYKTDPSSCQGRCPTTIPQLS
jgi:hypothetical protein